MVLFHESDVPHTIPRRKRHARRRGVRPRHFEKTTTIENRGQTRFSEFFSEAENWSVPGSGSVWASVPAVAPALFLSPAPADSRFRQRDPSPALNESAERAARLVADAKRKASLSSTLAAGRTHPVVAAFERRYGSRSTYGLGQEQRAAAVVSEAQPAASRWTWCTTPRRDGALHRGAAPVVRSPYQAS